MSLGLSVEELEYLSEAQVGIENALRSHLSDYVEPLKLKCKDCYGGCKGTCYGLCNDCCGGSCKGSCGGSCKGTMNGGKNDS